MIKSKVMLAQGIFILIVVLLLILVLAVGIVFPIWLLVRCLSSDTPTPTKVMWVAMMLLFFPPFGFYIYGLRSNSPKIRATSFGAIIIAGLGLVAMLLAIPYVIKTSQNILENAIKGFDQENFLELNSEQRQNFKTSITTLKKELDGNWLSEAEHKQHAIALLQLFQIYAQDQKIDQSEYSDWQEKFSDRKLLTAQAILNLDKGSATKQGSSSTPLILEPERARSPERPVPE